MLQSGTTSDMIFEVAALVSLLSEALLLKPGDVIVTGTPSGVDFARDAKIYLKSGDVCKIEIEGVGLLQIRWKNKVNQVSDGLRPG